jgi:Tfp pilus assembly pilus retraction ATPase PilT
MLGKLEIVDFLRQGREEGWSDVWFASDGPFVSEHWGDLKVHDQIASADGLSKYVDELLESRPSARALFASRGRARFVVDDAQYGRARWTLYPSLGKTHASVRLLQLDVPELASLDLPPVIQALAMLDQGSVWMCGPTGAGKTTLAFSMAKYRCEKTETHCMVVGDPVEYDLRARRSYVESHQIGESEDFEDTEAALRTILSARARVVVPPEVFTAAEIGPCITLGETGHLVIPQIHSGSAIQGFLRILESVAGDGNAHLRASLRGSLAAIVATRLVKRSDGRGRRAVIEVLVNIPAVQAVIQNPERIAALADAMQSGSKWGMLTFDQHLRQLAQRQQIERDTRIMVSAADQINRMLGEERGVA